MNRIFNNSLILIIIVVFNSQLVIAEEFDATLKWSKRVELSTPVSGVIKKVFAKTGMVAASGETLIQLDPRSFKAILKQAKASFRNSDEQRQESKRELDRQTDMYDRTMLSEHDLQVAKNNVTAADAHYFQAESKLTQAKLNLEYSAIRTPFNATIISVHAVKGQVVASTIIPPVLVIVAEANRMLARIFIKSEKLKNLTLNQGAKVDVGGLTFEGKISNIAMEPDKLKTGHYAIDIIFDSKDKVLRAGQNAIVNL